MSDPHDEIVIPDRAVFKAAEVCEIAKVQPYVLRSWETEFPDLGVAKTAGGARVYRQHDVRRVLEIKRLVFAEGLTIAGARKRLEQAEHPFDDQTSAAAAADVVVIDDDVRMRLERIRSGLRAVLSLLDQGSGARRDFSLAAPRGAPASSGTSSGGRRRAAEDAGRRRGAK